MEESEKRRQRLQAMRMEASHAEAMPSPPPPSPSSSAAHLSNPLINSVPSPIERSPPASRFDFYTDPMAAFSGDRRRSGGGSRGGSGGGGYYSLDNLSSPSQSPSPMPHPLYRPNAGPRNYHMATPYATPPHQFQFNQSPNQSPWRSPVQFPSFSGHPGATPSSNPGSWSRSGGFSGHGGGFPPNYSPRAAGFRSPMNAGVRAGSPHSNSGRGRGWLSRGRGRGSPSPGRGGGRGRGFCHDDGSDENHLYKAMLKDPWRKLTPIVGNILVPRAGKDFWLPKSLSAKKARVDVESGVGFKSKSSLAECLALCLEEAENDEGTP